ncbi:MAG: hypothetical protein DLM69_00265 [Candidatus Chloroheliales bacterium]|nr:MAG: hypothetical protein DLM69_00265 [Chloroflexota bacterium]
MFRPSVNRWQRLAARHILVELNADDLKRIASVQGQAEADFVRMSDDEEYSIAPLDKSTFAYLAVMTRVGYMQAMVRKRSSLNELLLLLGEPE